MACHRAVLSSDIYPVVSQTNPGLSYIVHINSFEICAFGKYMIFEARSSGHSLGLIKS